jgi:hypothetical protein
VNPTIPKLGTQPRKILDALLMADGQWISKRRFIHDMGLTQAGAHLRIGAPIAEGRISLEDPALEIYRRVRLQKLPHRSGS